VFDFLGLTFPVAYKLTFLSEGKSTHTVNADNFWPCESGQRRLMLLKWDFRPVCLLVEIGVGRTFLRELTIGVTMQVHSSRRVS